MDKERKQQPDESKAKGSTNHSDKSDPSDEQEKKQKPWFQSEGKFYDDTANEDRRRASHYVARDYDRSS